MSEAHFRSLENMYTSAPSNDGQDLRVMVSPGRAELSMVIQRDMFHSAGAVSGAFVYKLLEDACFLAANGDVDDVFLLTASFNVQHIGPAISGELRAEAQVIQNGRTLVYSEARLYDNNNELLALGSGSFTRSQLPLNEVPGYAE